MDNQDTEELRGASNVLVLAPLTPDGNRAHMEFIASTVTADTNIASVTYTQPPVQWLDDWHQNIGTFPGEIHHIHASGMAQADSNDEPVPDRVSTEVVDPTDPMAIIAPLSDRLEAWADGDTRPVVSVQTLTVLLEYVDFDTTFRYLHILTHRIQAADATGYFQMDPDIHEPEIVNALKPLFDVVVELSEGSVEWNPTAGVSSDTDTTDLSDSATTNTSTNQSSDGLLSSIRTTLSKLFDRNESNDDQSGVAPDDEPAPVTPDVEIEEEQTPVKDREEEEMITDQERIRSLLMQYGGRMKQAAFTDETQWSKSSVSRKLSEMEANGEITRVQIGRENVVFLGGSEPDATK
ncbi:helix-turn-helix transcriptional regulator [Haladaptatus sp. NG-SE-30]